MIEASNVQLIDILLVEDNIGDIELTKEAFSSAGMPDQVSIVRDGQEALDYLYRRVGYKDALRPQLILMDLNMPRKNGLEVLAIIKEDEDLKDIPVMILTSSEAQRDIINSYKLRANAYIVKPSDLSQFLCIVETIKSFWMDVVKLPPRQKQESLPTSKHG